MNQLRKLLAKVLLVLYYWVESIIFHFIPRRFKFKDISEEIVLVTGAGSGIGRLMSLKFGRKGAILVLWDVNGEGNEETAKMIQAEGGKAYTYKVDVTDKNAVYKAADKIRENVGDVTILVNNAGIVAGQSILELDDETVEKVFYVNVLSHFWITKAFLSNMMQKNHGHLVSIASLAGVGGMPKLTDYCASKFAAVGFMESLCVELNAAGYNNIHTTTVCPYFINTGMFNGASSRIFEMLEPEYVANEIVEGVLINKELILMPRLFYALNILKSLIPIRSLLALHDGFGGFECMEQFSGRSLKSKAQ